MDVWNDELVHDQKSRCCREYEVDKEHLSGRKVKREQKDLRKTEREREREGERERERDRETERNLSPIESITLSQAS